MTEKLNNLIRNLLHVSNIKFLESLSTQATKLYSDIDAMAINFLQNSKNSDYDYNEITVLLTKIRILLE